MVIGLRWCPLCIVFTPSCLIIWWDMLPQPHKLLIDSGRECHHKIPLGFMIHIYSQMPAGNLFCYVAPIIHITEFGSRCGKTHFGNWMWGSISIECRNCLVLFFMYIETTPTKPGKLHMLGVGFLQVLDYLYSKLNIWNPYN